MLALVSSSLALAAPLQPEAITWPEEDARKDVSFDGQKEAASYGGYWSVPVNASTNPSTQGRFVIISRPHAGAGWFKDMLNAHPDINCYGELLSPRGPAHLSKWYSEFLKGEKKMLRREGPDAKDDLELYSKKKDVPFQGFKWYHSQADIDLFEPPWHNGDDNTTRAEAYSRASGFIKFLKDYDFKVFIIDRQDRVTRYVSERQTGDKFTLDLPPMREQLFLDRQYGEHTQELLKKHDIEVYQLEYSDLVEHTHHRMRWMYQWLGVDPNIANYTAVYKADEPKSGSIFDSSYDHATEHRATLRDVLWNYDDLVHKLAEEAPAFSGELLVDRYLHVKSWGSTPLRTEAPDESGSGSGVA